jgi:hypothetical protein
VSESSLGPKQRPCVPPVAKAGRMYTILEALYTACLIPYHVYRFLRCLSKGEHKPLPPQRIIRRTSERTYHQRPDGTIACGRIVGRVVMQTRCEGCGIVLWEN